MPAPAAHGMHDRILEFLRQKGCPIPADRVLSEALGIRSPNTATADKVLRAMLRNDPRFRNTGGHWSLSGRSEPDAALQLRRAAVLFIEQATGSRDLLHVRGAVFIPETGYTDSFPLPSRIPDFAMLRRIRSSTEGRILVSWMKKDTRLFQRILHRHGVRQWEGDIVDLRGLAERLAGQGAAMRLPSDLSPLLGLPAPDTEDPVSMARFLAACWQGLLDRTPEEHRRDASSLRQWLDAARPEVDFSKFGFGAAVLQSLPESPGVYVMKNRANDIIYVGKSRNLKRRIRSYFTAVALRDPKVRRIHEQLHTFEVIATANEVDALLLETRMIRDFRPSINLQEEVHEQAEAYGKKRNCLLLVPDPNGTTAKIFLLRDGSFVGQASARLGQPAGKRLCSRVKSLYFGLRTRFRKEQESWETEIVSRWLVANKSRTNFVDVDEAGTFEMVIQRLSAYLQDRDRLTRKVLYR